MRPRVSYGTFLLGVVLGLLGFVVWVYADPATHKLPDQSRQRHVWFGDLATGYVVSGCTPSVPGALTLGAFACEGYVKDTTTGELLYAAQAAAAVGPLNSGNGTYWLALSRDTSTSHSGWTRQGGTQYLWRLSATLPATTTGLLIVSQITVAGGTITAVSSVSGPAGLPLAKVYGGGQVVSVMAAGAKCDGTTDDTIALTRAIASNQTTIIPAGVTCMTRGVSVTDLTNFTITGGGTLKLWPDTDARVLEIHNSTDFAVIGIRADGNKDNQPSPLNRVNDSLWVADSYRFLILGNTLVNAAFGACLVVNNTLNPLNAPNQQNNGVIAHNILKDCGTASPLVLGDGLTLYCDNCTAHDNVILNASDTAIAVLYSKNVNVHHNIIRGDSALASGLRTVQAIALLGVSNAVVDGNLVEWAQSGIGLTLSGNPAVAPNLSTKVTISNNIVRNIVSTPYNADGIISDVLENLHVTILGNSITNAERGIVVVPNDSYVGFNRIYLTSGIGIYLGGLRSKAMANFIQSPGGDGIFAANDSVFMLGNAIDSATVCINHNSKNTIALWNVNASCGTDNANSGNMKSTSEAFILPNATAIRSYNGDLTTGRDVLYVDPNSLTSLNLNGFALGLLGVPSSATVGAAGGAAALPATPTGYIPWSPDSGGTVYKIPYYAE